MFAALGIAEETSFVWIRANPKADSTPHAMDPWGDVQKGPDMRRAPEDSGWSGTKEAKQWRASGPSGSSGWHP